MNAKGVVAAAEDGIEAVTPRTIKLAASIADKPAQWIVNFLLLCAAAFIGYAVMVMPEKYAEITATIRADFGAMLVDIKQTEKEKLKSVLDNEHDKLKMILTHQDENNKAKREIEKETVAVLKELNAKLDRLPKIKMNE